MLTEILNKLYKTHENKLAINEPKEPSLEEYKTALAQLQAQLAAVYKDRDYLQAQNTLLMSQLVSAQALQSLMGAGALPPVHAKDPATKAQVGFKDR